MFQIVIVGDESAIMIFPNIQIISEWRPSTSWCIPELQIYTEIPFWSLPRQNPSSGLAWRSLTTHPMPRMDARGWKQCLMFIYVYQMFEVPTVLFRFKSQQLFIISPKACQHVVLCPWRLSFKPTIHQALRGVPEVWVPPTARCCGSEVPMEDHSVGIVDGFAKIILMLSIVSFCKELELNEVDLQHPTLRNTLKSFSSISCSYAHFNHPGHHYLYSLRCWEVYE